MMHPSIKILIFSSGVITIYFLSNKQMVLLAILSVLAVLFFTPKPFIKLVLKMALFFLSIILVYAFFTPGEYIKLPVYPNQTMLTFEGLMAGALQALRLITVLALMSILVNTMSRMQLLYGLANLLKPFTIFKWPIERLIVRIHLTISYAEYLLKQPSKFTLHFFDAPELMPTLEHESVDFSTSTQAMSDIDYVALIMMLFVILSLIIY